MNNVQKDFRHANRHWLASRQEERRLWCFLVPVLFLGSAGYVPDLDLMLI